MIIEKQAHDWPRFRRDFEPFASARAAFLAFLRQVSVGANECVLLPAYVGWSAREGSGVFDPIREAWCAFAFYRVDQRLRADVDDVARQLRERRVKVLVVIHYFGYVD